MMKCRYYLKKFIHAALAATLIFVTLFVGRNGLAEAQNADCSAETTEKALLYEKIVLG
ncbi:MAG TPA: hypothetical protein H9904_05700 [Candidatus Mediterraneibacter guildfordensis]|nr:hypothetical protein [Candidatus Mediterraneibacter guildfordensis]